MKKHRPTASRRLQPGQQQCTLQQILLMGSRTPLPSNGKHGRAVQPRSAQAAASSERQSLADFHQVARQQEEPSPGLNPNDNLTSTDANIKSSTDPTDTPLLIKETPNQLTTQKSRQKFLSSQQQQQQNPAHLESNGKYLRDSSSDLQD